MKRDYRIQNTEYRTGDERQKTEDRAKNGGFWRIYLTGVMTSIKSSMAYRANFILINLFDLVWTIAAPLVTVLIYGAGASFPGWTFWEAMLMQAIFGLSSALCAVFVENIVWMTMDHVREGTLETVLLKPMSPILFMVSTVFRVNSFGGVFGGMVLFVISSAFCAITPANIPLCILMFIAGFAVNSSAALICAAASFRWVANSRLDEIRISLENFGKYPVKIFPGALRVIMTFFLPFAAMGCFPAEILLGRFDMINLLALIPAALFMLFAVWLYSHMIHLYEGVGG